jgi:hypothetical protein
MNATATHKRGDTWSHVEVVALIGSVAKAARFVCVDCLPLTKAAEAAGCGYDAARKSATRVRAAVEILRAGGWVAQ